MAYPTNEKSEDPTLLKITTEDEETKNLKNGKTRS